MQRATGGWSVLTEKEILEGQKRVLEFYPLGNAPLRVVFPILNNFKLSSFLSKKKEGEDKIQPVDLTKITKTDLKTFEKKISEQYNLRK